ncbi:hypothetical protein DL764_009499 [Monosporascus ibericus]|uniref:Uncharacterized protein n=1 Tax=Monosporascus ibericus TaxID=155417 RepID=A0A4V1X8Y8_9PEZI|nr:hypothetical protein DL764_009499 [Monosporascus ibericus]
MSRIGALTTTFTPPAACATSTGLYLVDCGEDCSYHAKGPLETTSCYPDDYDPQISSGYYSPGICPSGYTEACSRAESMGTATEWAYTCCPSVESNSYSCLPTAYLEWDLTLGCQLSMSSGTFTLFDITAMELNGQMSVQSSTVGNDFRIGAHAIEVRRQATDASLTAATTSRPSDTSPADTSGAISGFDSNGRNSSSINGNNSTEGDGDSTGFPPGVAAGIGAGGTVALLGLGVGIFFLCRRRRAKRKALSTDEGNSNASPLMATTVEATSPGSARGYYEPESAKALGTFEHPIYGGAYEMEGNTTIYEIGPGKDTYELQTESRPQELQTESRPQELQTEDRPQELQTESRPEELQAERETHS